MNEYTKQAEDFLTKTNTKMTVTFIEHGNHFVDETAYRDIFKVTFKRNKKQFSLRFGQSLNDSTGTGDNIPTAYSVLTCIQKYPVYSFNEFSEEFGYDLEPLSNYTRIKKIYNAVKKEYANVCKIWDKDEIEKLSEIN